MKIEIGIFYPIRFKKKELDLNRLNAQTGKNWHYAANGRSALYHCLCALDIQGTILGPNYICHSIKPILKKKSLEVIYYDFDSQDCNANIDDIKSKIFLHPEISCLLVASMYGNPADMVQLEGLCKEHGIKLIDDAAQSFGAKIQDRFIGTFGDAGFMAFSPGKPTSAHMGALFWTSNEQYSFRRTRHFILHYLAYSDFYFNRYYLYKYKKIRIFSILSLLKIHVSKHFDMTFDEMCKFERKILGGVLNANFQQTYRKTLYDKFEEKLHESQSFHPIRSPYRDRNPHKFILSCQNTSTAKELISFLRKNNIYAASGYPLMDRNAQTPVANENSGKILEIPLENNEPKMNHIISLLKQYDEYSRNNHHL